MNVFLYSYFRKNETITSSNVNGLMMHSMQLKVFIWIEDNSMYYTVITQTASFFHDPKGSRDDFRPMYPLG